MWAEKPAAFSKFQKIVTIRVNNNMTPFQKVCIHCSWSMFQHFYILKAIYSGTFLFRGFSVSTLHAKLFWYWLWSQYLLRIILVKYTAILKAKWKSFNGSYFLCGDCKTGIFFICFYWCNKSLLNYVGLWVTWVVSVLGCVSMRVARVKNFGESSEWRGFIRFWRGSITR